MSQSCKRSEVTPAGRHSIFSRAKTMMSVAKQSNTVAMDRFCRAFTALGGMLLHAPLVLSKNASTGNDSYKAVQKNM